MSSTGDIRVSARRQMQVPARVRRHWDLEDGGVIGHIDLGEIVLLLPKRAESLRRQLLESVTERDWEAARAGFGDPDTATEQR